MSAADPKNAAEQKNPESPEQAWRRKFQESLDRAKVMTEGSKPPIEVPVEK
jgi:hypothetical protein